MIISPFYGESLSDKLKKSTLSEDYVRVIAYSLCKAVGYIHSLGIAHRDIKPSNILISHEGSPTLIDFGFAGYNNVKCGTKDYYAPE